MYRRGAIALAAGIVLPGCLLLGGNRGVSRPPQEPIAARTWWHDTVERVGIGTLRCWHQASEFHRQRGSSAVYLDHRYVGHTMAGPYYHDQYLPAPIPAELLPKVHARLAQEPATEDQSADLVTVEQCARCTKQEAIDAWRRYYK